MIKRAVTISLIICISITLFLIVAGLLTIPSKKTVSPATPTPLTGKFTLKSVATHNSTSDCWIVINNKIYNVTSYLDLHPGGWEIMANYCGKDGTQAFATKEKTVRPQEHTQTAKDLLPKYFVADVGTQ